MQFRTAACTHVGMRRTEHEDRNAILPELGLVLVADGMGGHRAGQVASRIACEAAARAVETLQAASVSLAERLRHAVASANREIYVAAQQLQELQGMGTTMVGLLASEERLALAHVGDSRAYLLRGGRFRCLTDDHSIVAELVRRQEISEEDAREHPHRHVLTRALGVQPRTEPDLAEMTPHAGDLLVLCSDGLTGHVSDESIAALLERESDLDRAAQALVDEANEAGGLDNITVVLMRVDKAGA